MRADRDPEARNSKIQIQKFMRRHNDQFVSPKTGSLLQPLMRTPLDVGSMRKWRTSSLDGSEGFFPATCGGGVATFNAKPKAPGNEFESRTINVPGD